MYKYLGKPDEYMKLVNGVIKNCNLLGDMEHKEPVFEPQKSYIINKWYKVKDSYKVYYEVYDKNSVRIYKGKFYVDNIEYNEIEQITALELVKRSRNECFRNQTLWMIFTFGYYLTFKRKDKIVKYRIVEVDNAK